MISIGLVIALVAMDTSLSWEQPLLEANELLVKLGSEEGPKKGRRVFRSPHIGQLELAAQMQKNQLQVKESELSVIHPVRMLTFSFHLPLPPSPILLPPSLPPPVPSLLVLLVEYFKLFSTKGCCFEDMKMFLGQLTPENTTKVGQTSCRPHCVTSDLLFHALLLRTHTHPTATESC